VWHNTTIASRGIAEEINALKKKNEKDMIVYGGHTFVSSLIQQALIDEFFLLVNPVAFGSGERIFNILKNNLHLALKKCQRFACGTVLLHYMQQK